MTANAHMDPLPALTPGGGARIARVRADAPRGQTLSEALLTLGEAKLGDRTFDIAALEIGEKIREARQRAHLTQDALADLIGCKQADISSIELGKGVNGPTYRVLRDLAEALNVEISVGPSAASPDDFLSVKTLGGVVTCAEANYRDYIPLLTLTQWSKVRAYVNRTLHNTNNDLRGRCTFVSLEPKTKARLSVHKVAGALVMATVRGQGSVSIHKGVHRQSGPLAAGKPVGILGAGTDVEVVATDEPLAIVTVPTGVLMDFANGRSSVIDGL